MLLSAALTVVVVAAIIIAAVRVLPRMCGAGNDVAPTRTLLTILAATALANVASHVVGAPVVAALVALLTPHGAQVVVASPDAGEQLADSGAFAVFSLLVAPLAAVAITRAFTLRRGVIVRVAVAALAGEAALTVVVIALLRPFWARRIPTAAPVDPLFDLVGVVAHTVDTIAVFAIVGVAAGVAFAVVAIGPALRARDANERRALVVAGCVAAPAALVLGGLASPSPDVLSQMLLTIMIGMIWLVAVVLGLGVRGLAGLRTSRAAPPG